jgi:hypothetical protein
MMQRVMMANIPYGRGGFAVIKPLPTRPSTWIQQAPNGSGPYGRNEYSFTANLLKQGANKLSLHREGSAGSGGADVEYDRSGSGLIRARNRALTEPRTK